MALTAGSFGGTLGRLRRTARRTPVGLDVGTTTITAVQLSMRPGPSGGSLPEYDIAALATVQRAGHDRGGASAALTASDVPALQRLKQQARFAGRSVIVGLDTPLLDIQSLSLPVGERGLDDPAIGAALTFELARHVTYDLALAEIRSWLLPRSMGAGPNVMGVACRRDCLKQTARISSLAGLQCRRVEPGCLALLRACAAARCLEQQVIWGVLDIGYATSRLTLAVGTVPVLHREMDGGGARFSSLIAQRLGVSELSAEQLKRQYGLSTTGGPPAPVAGSAKGPDGTEVGRLVFASLRRELGRLAAEVERSFSYVIHLYPDAIVGQLCLVGGSANLGGLDTTLSDQIGIPVTVGRPPAGEPIAPGEGAGAADAALLQAAGLAMLGAEAGEA